MPLGKLGKYERVDVLGHGISGIVYLAWDTLLKKQVALKEIDVQAADVNRFLEEARVMDRLNHPNIVRVNGVDMIEGHVVIDMEYVKGQNLQQLLRAEGRLPLDRALDIAIQTLDALDYAHRMRTVHRDIKPANILTNRAGEVKLVDFGLAEILSSNSYAGGAGTYAYMAPEDFADEHHSDHQSDIWAVGVTLYEMLTGRRPFNVERTKDPFAWRRALLTLTPAPLSPPPAPPCEGGDRGGEDDFPAGLQAVLDRALARDKRDRYPSAGAFRDDLIAIREGREPIAVGMAVVCAGKEEATTCLKDEGRRACPERSEGMKDESAPLPPSSFLLHPSALLARRKAALPARVTVEPQAIHFGEVRKGDERAGKIRVRFEGGKGSPSGRVTFAPPWLTVYPNVLDRRKLTLTLTAHSDRVWQTGDYEDAVRLETSAGEVRIPVGIRVLKPRRAFQEVAVWFLPLVIAALLPSLTVGWGARFTAMQYLVPSAALGSGLLAAMLLLVAFEADLGITEKLVCLVLMTVMCLVLGVTVGFAARTGHPEGIGTLPATGMPIGLLLVFQTASRRHWKLWAAVIGLLALLTAGTFASVLVGQA
jgi:predicted Ser/Thr protein kinase